MLDIRKWVVLFMEQYRFEALKLGPKDKTYLEPYVKEQLLLPPCEVDVVIFANPFCLALFFFFGPRGHDRQVSLHSSRWAEIPVLLGKLKMKHSIQVDLNKLKDLMDRMSKNISGSSLTTGPKPIYGIDFIPNVCCIYFYQDLRIEAWPWNSEGHSKPSDVASRVFHLNYCQAVDEATSGEILEAAWKELEKLGYKKVDWQGK
jgi:hypothetical protein